MSMINSRNSEKLTKVKAPLLMPLGRRKSLSLTKLGIVLSLFMVILAPPAETKPATFFLPRFEALIHKTMKQKKVPGLAVAIVMDGKVIFMKGFGVREVGRPRPIDIHTVFQIGSASKAITSVLVAILKRDQILSLDHPVGTISNATVRNVLSHTTGIPSAGFNALIERGVPAIDVYRKVKKTTSDGLPGEKFSYHNVVYSLIGEIIARQSGTSFEDVLQTQLCKPLHMRETSSTWHGFNARANRASVHCVVNDNKQKRKKGKKWKKGNTSLNRAVKVPYRQDYARFPAAAGCSSSIHDMSLFLAAILGARPDVLSPHDLDAFIKPLVHTPDQWYRSRAHRDRITKTHYGLGWRTMTFGGYHLVFHAGWIRGITSLISFIPEKKVGIVILQNAELNLPFRLSMQFYDWILGLPQKQWFE